MSERCLHTVSMIFLGHVDAVVVFVLSKFMADIALFGVQLFLGSVIMDSRRNTRQRISRLLYLASDEVLDQVETLLRKQVPDRNPAIFRNPSGGQSRKPCKICGGQRPPLLEAQPWQLHSSKSGIQVGHGGVCSSCIWAQRVGRNRSEWPHWESFRLGQWSPHRGVKRAALSP